jgi:hypothetical protein
MVKNAEQLAAMAAEIGSALEAATRVLGDIAKKYGANEKEEMQSIVGCLSGMLVALFIRQGLGVQDMRDAMEQTWVLGQLSKRFSQ